MGLLTSNPMFHNSRPASRPHNAALSQVDYSAARSYYQNLQPSDPLPTPPPNNKDPRNSSASVRRRTSRACDQCNQLRTRCNGQLPCEHCVQCQLNCRYARLPKKRGKLSKRELAEKEAAESRRPSIPPQEPMPASSFNNGLVPPLHSHQTAPSSWDESSLQTNGEHMDQARDLSSHTTAFNTPDSHQTTNPIVSQLGPPSTISTAPSVAAPYAVDHMRNYRIMPSEVDNANISEPDTVTTRVSRPYPPSESTQDMSYTYKSEAPSLQNDFGLAHDAPFLMESSSLLDFESSQKALSPSTNSGATPSTSGFLPNQKSSTRYPVLQPLVPHIKNIMPAHLACDLLEHYFSSSSSSYPRPASPYLLGFVFSRRSFLTVQNPRPCSPALLASMLWIAAQTCNARFLITPASTRDKISQKLFNLTIALLKPPIHGGVVGKQWGESEASLRSGVSASGDNSGVNLSPTAIHGTLDDVATYIHIAIVSSAGESKGGSLRWWYAAWTLARELKLGQEISSTPEQDDFLDDELEHEQGNHAVHREDANSRPITEEVREERRRVWWLLYLVDRHLGLCYNRPIVLLDRECHGLLRPMDEQIWHSGNFDDHPRVTRFSPGSIEYKLEFTGPGIFGYFLPLMTILGEIVDLQNARWHPLVQCGIQSFAEWDSQLQQAVLDHLEIFERSMRNFESKHLPPVGSRGESPKMNESRHLLLNEAQIHLKIAIAYSTHILHVLHILVTGKWDPISLLDDDDNWISSPSFLTAIRHAVDGAEAVTDILHYDPEINFMPFLYGIYLLQGSFLLLLIADKLHSQAIANVVSACETIVRAHEACVVTLSTEYQRAFRKVMQSALAQARGRAPADAADQQRRRRDTLELFRWTPEGTGLAT